MLKRFLSSARDIVFFNLPEKSHQNKEILMSLKIDEHKNGIDVHACEGHTCK